MTNEEINEITARADYELDRLKDNIHELYEENKQLKEKINIYENPDDMTLMFMWCDEKAKDKIKDLQHKIDKAIEYIKHSWWLRTDQVYDTSKDLKDWEAIELLEILEGKENE